MAKKEKMKNSFLASKELQGLWLLSCAVLMALSQLSFSSGRDPKNFFGLVGFWMGWLVQVFFGISGYLLAFFLGWLGWRFLFKKEVRHLGMKVGALFLAMVSLSLVLSVIEEEAPRLDRVLRLLFLPGMKKGGFHLGGSFFYYLYHDLPLFSIKGLLHGFGTLIVFIPALFFSLTYLLKSSPLAFIKNVRDRLRARTSRSVPEEILVEEPSIPPPRKWPKILESLPLAPVEDEPVLEVPLKKKIVKPITHERILKGDFNLPSMDLLHPPKKQDNSAVKQNLKKQAALLEETFQSFGIEAKVGKINIGPTITSFEVHPAVGVKVQKIKSLENDIALNMEAKSIRIIAPIPGKAAVGIEVPNIEPQEVSFKEMMETYQARGQRFKIPVLLGKAVDGEWIMSDLAKMPHCIIAGATGSGKSVCINTIVISILMNHSPDEIRLLMVDPKKVELTSYSRLPHMLAPVITEPREACHALNWLVKEMEKRYEILKRLGLRNIEAFNTRKRDLDAEKMAGIEIPEKMAYYVAIIDELADLMMVSASDIETPIARIAQMARAVGIHLILATQRPSREVITGLIKANFPTRIAFKVASRINSQIILDEVGAESLLGNGDMLFLPPGTSQLIRAQGAFIRDEEIQAIIAHVEKERPPNYLIQSFEKYEELAPSEQEPETELYRQAKEIVLATGKASATYLQTSMKIGYPTAARLIDELESKGIIGPKVGSGGREVLIGRLPFEDD